MDGHADVGGQRAHFDGEDAFGDQLACACTDDADSEDTLCFRIDQQLSQTFWAVERDGASGSGPGELGDGDFASLFFGLSFGEAGPRDFGIGEDDGGNRVRLESDFVSGDGFDGATALVHCFVGQHRFAGYVTDGVNGRFRGLALLVDFDETLGVDFHFGLVEPGDLGIRAASYGHQDAVEYLFFFFYIRTIEGYADAGLFIFQRFDCRVEQDRGEKFFQTLVQ